MKSLNETIREGETKKRQLEESLDALQEEVSQDLVFGHLKIRIRKFLQDPDELKKLMTQIRPFIRERQ